MGHMELDAQPIEFTYRGRTQTYRPMSQPSHLWEEIDFDSLEGNDTSPRSKIMIRMNQRVVIMVQIGDRIASITWELLLTTLFLSHRNRVKMEK